MEKILSALLVVGALFMLTACGNKEENLTLTPTEIIAKMYEGFAEDELPMALGDRELVAEELEYNLGLKELDFVEGTVSEPMISSIAHSVVLIRLKDGEDIEAAKTKIKENVKADKWICVQAEKVTVKSKGHLIMLVMSSEDQATKIEANFDNLK